MDSRKHTAPLTAESLCQLHLNIQPVLDILAHRLENGKTAISLRDIIPLGIWKVEDFQNKIQLLEQLASRYPEMRKGNFANHMKVSRQTIYNWTNTGHIMLTPDKKRILTTETLALWRFISALI